MSKPFELTLRDVTETYNIRPPSCAQTGEGSSHRRLDLARCNNTRKCKGRARTQSSISARALFRWFRRDRNACNYWSCRSAPDRVHFSATTETVDAGAWWEMGRTTLNDAGRRIDAPTTDVAFAAAPLAPPNYATNRRVSWFLAWFSCGVPVSRLGDNGFNQCWGIAYYINTI